MDWEGLSHEIKFIYLFSHDVVLFVELLLLVVIVVVDVIVVVAVVVMMMVVVLAGDVEPRCEIGGAGSGVTKRVGKNWLVAVVAFLFSVSKDLLVAFERVFPVFLGSTSCGPGGYFLVDLIFVGF